MEWLKDQRVIAGLGAVVAVTIGLLAAVLFRGTDKPASAAPPASKGGLVVETGRDDDVRLDPARPLRCFVNGQFVAELPLAECAQRNGVATGALDVGVDESGALAAAESPGTLFTPLPPTEVVTPPETPTQVAAPGPQTPATTIAQAVQTCWRYDSGAWRPMPGSIALNSCVQSLYAGRCERAGGATYGRWGDQTLRLVPGRVEISSDNRSFRTLVEQGPGCAIGSVG